MSTGTCFFWAVSVTTSLTSRASFTTEVLLLATPKPMQICRSISMSDPLVAMTGITLYWEGWSLLAVYLRAVDLPEPTSPVIKEMAPSFIA